MLKHLALVAALVGSAWPSLAADGDACGSAATDYDWASAGGMKPVWCVALCDNKSTNTNCTTFDLNTTGISDVVVFELHEVDVNANGTFDCSAGTVTFATTSDGGLLSTSVNVFPIGGTTAVAIGGTRRIAQDNVLLPLGRYVAATTSGLAGNCTDDAIDVLMIGYEEQ